MLLAILPLLCLTPALVTAVQVFPYRIRTTHRAQRGLTASRLPLKFLMCYRGIQVTYAPLGVTTRAQEITCNQQRCFTRGSLHTSMWHWALASSITNATSQVRQRGFLAHCPFNNINVKSGPPFGWFHQTKQTKRKGHFQRITKNITILRSFYRKGKNLLPYLQNQRQKKLLRLIPALFKDSVWCFVTKQLANRLCLCSRCNHRTTGWLIVW